MSVEWNFVCLWEQLEHMNLFSSQFLARQMNVALLLWVLQRMAAKFVKSSFVLFIIAEFSRRVNDLLISKPFFRGFSYWDETLIFRRQNHKDVF